MQGRAGVLTGCWFRAQTDRFAPLLLWQQQKVGGCRLVIPPLQKITRIISQHLLLLKVVEAKGSIFFKSSREVFTDTAKQCWPTCCTSAVVLSLVRFMLTAISVIQSISMWPSYIKQEASKFITPLKILQHTYHLPLCVCVCTGCRLCHSTGLL